MLRTFLFIAIILNYFVDRCFRVGGGLSDILKRGVQQIMCLDDNMERPMKALLKLDDSYDLPVQDLDMQCELCGVSYVRCKYVDGKKGMCGACAVQQKKRALEVVSLINGYMLRKLGVE